MYSFDGTMYEYIAYVDTGMNSFQHEFKYANGNTAADYETVPSGCAVNGNRATTVPKDSILESVCFGYCTNCLSIGIHEQQQVNTLQLSPNPTGDYSLLQINDGEPAHEISIVDISGRCVRTYSRYEGHSLRLEKGELGEGLYMITVRGNSSASTVKWFVQ